MMRAPARAAAPTGVQTAEPLVEVAGLEVTFRVARDGGRAQLTAVAGVDFSLRRGETFGLVGESGSGKTTLGRVLLGLERPRSGTVRLDGRELADLDRRALRAWRRRAQMVFQDPYASLDPRMRVEDIIAEPLRIHRLGSRLEQLERVSELLREVGLSADAARRRPREFSGGQRQRIGLARALALRPELIVADEPVSALDVSIRSQILNLLSEVQRRHALTCLLISHDFSVVRYLSDRIGVMYLGKLVEVGPTEEVCTNPAHPYTRALLDAVPLPDPQRERGKRRIVPAGDPPSILSPPPGCRFHNRCPRATDVCRLDEPAHTAVAASRAVACHHPLEPSQGDRA